MTWWNEYVGLPYKAKGRDRDGLDCWGLVRLIYQEQYNTILPSFAEVYEQKDHEKQAELLAMHREGWEKTQTPTTGDVVLFRINGSESHVGIVTNPTYFLHVREGQDAVIESLNSVVWKHRIVGIFKYKEGNKPLTVLSRPDPLKTIRIDTEMPVGITVRKMADLIRDNNGITKIWEDNAVIFVNGEIIPKESWELTIPKSGSVVEYRALALGGSSGRTIAMLAVMVAVAVVLPQLTPMIAGAGFGTAATLTTAATLSATGMAISVGAGIALSYAGSLLVNAIFPVRPAALGASANSGSPVPMNMLNGGSNQMNPYGAIPVVLGKIRWTPPIGAKTYLETIGTNNFLTTLLVWGYGRLQVSDLRIGETPMANFADCQVATVEGVGGESFTNFNAIYGRDVDQQDINITLLGSDERDPEDDGFTNVILSESDIIDVSFYFPEGLRQVQVDGVRAGQVTYAGVQLQVQTRQLNPDTLEPITAFGDVQRTISPYNFALKPAYFNIDNDEELEPVYQWYRTSVDPFNNVIVRRGAFTTNPEANPTGSLLTRLQQENFGLNAVYERLPSYGAGEEGLWDVVVYGDTIYASYDRRGSSGGLAVTGCDISFTDFNVSIASGTIDRAENETVILGLPNLPYYNRKNAFSYRIRFPVARGVYEVRARRITESLPDTILQDGSGANARRFWTSILQTITGYKNSRPVTPPRPLAMTALRVRATNQLNGNLDGISATCISVCKDYDRVSETWVDRPTRNPASLFRYVLQHPANVKRVLDSQLDLSELQVWHEYCRINAFMFDAVLTGQESLIEVLRDIAAAGRASPMIKDGKWMAIIDKPRSSYAQYFTPHNSWGFEGVRSMPVLPHGFRVQFANSEKAYEPDEMIVYSDGYSIANATRLEGLSLRGVTTKKAIYKHARFHLAQLKLRPETYSINADIEHIVCNRGDLVKVNHDVPMWGLLSGRIAEKISNTRFILDETFEQALETDYTIRVRSVDGSSETANIKPIPTGGLMGFERNSIATYIDDGLVKTAAIDIPRYVNNELLIEPEATNLIEYSQDLSNAWFTRPAGHTQFGDGITAPDGISTAQLVLNTTFSNRHVIYKTITVEDVSNLYTVTVFAKNYVGTSQAYLTLYCGVGGFQSSSRFGRRFDLLNGVMQTPAYSTDTATGFLVSSSIELVGNGWYKCQITGYSTLDDNRWATAVSIQDQFTYIENLPLSYAGDGDTGLYLWGFDAKESTGISSYIPTNGSIGTRQADIYDEGAIVLESELPNAEREDLFLLGTLNEESVDLVVQSIEPMDNMTARITLVDYSPDIYNSDSEVIPEFDSQITLPPMLVQPRITQKPVITTVVSDESAMVKLAPSKYEYQIRVNFENPENLPEGVSFVEGQIDATGDSDISWLNTIPVNVSERSIYFKEVQLADEYKLRLRYVDQFGRVGAWSNVITHTVVGRTTLPARVSAISASPEGTKVRLSWDANKEPDVLSYEVRNTDTNWGSTTVRPLYKGNATNCLVNSLAVGQTGVWYIKAIDDLNLYSATSRSVSLVMQSLPNPSAINYIFADTSLTNATITLDWEDLTPQFGLRDYVVNNGIKDYSTKSSSITLPANWIGQKTFTVKSRDNKLNQSTGRTRIITKLAPNAAPSGVAKISNGVLTLDWADAVETTLPVWGYEVRKDLSFGTSGFVFKGSASTCVVSKNLINTETNAFYIKTLDTDNNYSSTYLTINHQYQSVPDVTNVTFLYADTALTNATITIKWDAAIAQYGVDYYEITYDSITTTVKATNITLEANWIGNRAFLIKTVDFNGNKSSGYTLNANLSVPNSANNYRASVIDNNVMLYWTLPTKTSLPIRHALIKKGANWDTAVLVGEKSGEFTTINEPQGGTFTYWIALVDTDGNESAPISLTAKVSEPPDFIFFGSQDSTFTGTLTSAYLENATVIIPVNTTESWQDHFANQSPAWATIQDQIDAGYPIYIQPANLDGNYQEVFDFGTILASSRITVSVGGEIVAGSPATSVNIDTSDDNITWATNEGVTEIFATLFRYVRVTVKVTGDDLSVYKLESLNVRADAKQITDSGKVSAVSTDPSGTIVNFNKTFIDVESITATAASTNANIVVYDFKDSLLSGTYSVSSNVITVSITDHGLIAGQKVRLGFISGTAPTGIVTIATALTNSFTANLTTANTSGSLSAYPESFRVYVFNTSGTRVSSTVSWNARGY
jgi:sulfur carrier protein ThiS